MFVKGFQPITAMVLVDTSASMTLNLDLARTAAEQLVIRMMPGDQVRVGSLSDRLDLSKGFTGDRDELLRALREDLHIGNPTKLWDGVGETMTALAPLGGRRILVLMTDGVDTMSTVTADNIIERAREDELMIYIVQFRSTMRAATGRDAAFALRRRVDVRPDAMDDAAHPDAAAPGDADRRRPLPAESVRRRQRHVHAGHAGAALPVRAGLHAAAVRRQGARPAGPHSETRTRTPRFAPAATTVRRCRRDRALFHRSGPGGQSTNKIWSALSPCEPILWKRALSPIIDRLMPHPAGSLGPCSSALPRLPCRRVR